MFVRTFCTKQRDVAIMDSFIKTFTVAETLSTTYTCVIIHVIPMCQISGLKCLNSTIIIISQAVIPGNGNIFCQNSAWNASRLLNAQCNIN